MKTVQRGNKQLRVDDSRLEAMLQSGYVEVDAATGKPISPPVKPDRAALKQENAALKQENEELRARVAELTAQSAKAKG